MELEELSVWRCHPTEVSVSDVCIFIAPRNTSLPQSVKETGIGGSNVQVCMHSLDRVLRQSKTSVSNSEFSACSSAGRVIPALLYPITNNCRKYR